MSNYRRKLGNNRWRLTTQTDNCTTRMEVAAQNRAWAIYDEDSDKIVETVSSLDDAVSYVQRAHYKKLANSAPQEPRGKVCDKCGTPVVIKMDADHILIRCECIGSARHFYEQKVYTTTSATLVRQTALEILNVASDTKHVYLLAKKLLELKL